MLNAWFSKVSGQQSVYPWQLRVVVPLHRSPQHACFAAQIDAGAEYISDVCIGNPVREEHLVFVFPERHMTMVECQRFLPQLASWRQIRSVDVITCSPQILQTVPADVLSLFSELHGAKDSDRETYGASVDQVLKVLEVPLRANLLEVQTLKAYHSLVSANKGDTAEAIALRQQLAGGLLAEDPELSGLDFERDRQRRTRPRGV